MPGNLRAVQKAIEDGRIRQAAVQVSGRGGRPEWKIRDCALADQLWEANRAPDQALRAATANIPRVVGNVPGGSPEGPVPTDARMTAAAIERQQQEQPAPATPLDPVSAARAQAAEKQLRFLDFRAQREAAEARIRQAKAAEVEGEMLPAAEVIPAQEELFRLWGERLSAMAPQLARQLAFQFSVGLEDMTRACERAIADFRRDVASEMKERAANAA